MATLNIAPRIYIKVKPEPTVHSCVIKSLAKTINAKGNIITQQSMSIHDIIHQPDWRAFTELCRSVREWHLHVSVII